jgi:hypothetical protein
MLAIKKKRKKKEKKKGQWPLKEKEKLVCRKV